MINELFSTIHEACSPKDWSRGVELGRRSEFLEEFSDKQKITLRVQEHGAPLSRVVSLWLEDHDWNCDCGGELDPCLHVIAAAIAVKHASEKGTALQKSKQALGIVAYRLKRKSGSLALERIIVAQGKSTPLATSLLALTSGKIPGPKIIPTREDLSIDALIKDWTQGIIPANYSSQLLYLLETCKDIELDGQSIKTSAKHTGFIARVEDQAGGVWLQGVQDPNIVEIFRNSFALCQGSLLRPIENNRLTPDELNMLAAGKHFGLKEIPYLVSELLPALEKKLSLEIRSHKLPQSIRTVPRVLFHTQAQDDKLLITAQIVYGDPPIAHVRRHDLIAFGVDIPVRDVVAEKNLQFKLNSELGFSADSPVSYELEEAFVILKRLQRWEGGKLEGEGVQHFQQYESLSPKIIVQSHDNKPSFEFYFQSEDLGSTPTSTHKSADPSVVLKAWEQGKSLVPLLDGGWAPLPKNWLDRYGHCIRELLSAQKEDSELKPWMFHNVVEICEDLATPLPSVLQEYKNFLSHLDDIPKAQLPKNLKATLRGYQEEGISWLSLLKQAKLAALLADDMGLGKTLQTICILEKPSLVIAPTSVVYNWEQEIKKFRPDLSVCIYHGQARKLDEQADVVLTSYAILRLDCELLTARNWNVVVLDEAQNIKNSDSQAAKASFKLQASFKLALSGTPIENSLDDAWSLFHFLTKGLLGPKKHFQQTYVRPILAGDPQSALQLKNKLKPFILRRLKSEVAKELPPRTDIVLYCELNDEERKVYESHLLATRKDVLAKFETSTPMMQILELLLRLRQASCHLSLIPGHTALSSSKVELLLSSLNECLAENHKVLIFSQWTSLLDLIEPELKNMNVSFARIDGSTKNRSEIVDQFQNQNTCKVLLLSLKAAGVGLNLTAADHVYILDPWWNPAIEDQAADRAHRIGQTNPVMVHKLVAKNTVEEKIILLQEKKRQLVQSVIGDQVAASITRDELMALFD